MQTLFRPKKSYCLLKAQAGFSNPELVFYQEKLHTTSDILQEGKSSSKVNTYIFDSFFFILIWAYCNFIIFKRVDEHAVVCIRKMASYWISQSLISYQQ